MKINQFIIKQNNWSNFAIIVKENEHGGPYLKINEPSLKKINFDYSNHVPNVNVYESLLCLSFSYSV